ncbi:sporulation integral membrane protein YlbJ [Clostridium sp. A1-XYC3]|uniref:Sporulation integral membrane protein YlbJ n=1 Tax=Clostridium tanneri TaxID=3037988 RepID=A0ABU4JSD4_9CLOT|nr:sporulation integral membrane protein YlbJ [Clostridium sp. A1-XYC3]MDW8801065.1 sporulation integral membrane protein YlbJ [Clostridium sp. A1-XYC3]
MKIIFYLIVLIIIILLAYLLKNKNIFITIVCSLLILQILAAPKICIDAAVNGALLFFYKVFPSLFSFLVVSNIILSYDGVYIYSRLLGSAICKPLRLPKSCSFVLIISVLCGYPLGAKYASDLYERNVIDLKTFERLLNIASNASPLFMLGSVGISMLKSPHIGYILLLSNLISCIAMGFLIPSNITNKKDVPKRNHIYSNMNIGNVLKGSVENSIKTCLSIGGFVTAYSVIIDILKNNQLFSVLVQQLANIISVPKSIIEGSILGIIEMTNGCNLISSSNASIYTKIAIVSFLFTFSGLSIISQVYSFTYKFDISMKKYTLRKIVQGLFCSLISLLFYHLSTLYYSKETFVYNHTPAATIENIFLITFIILTLPWIFFKLKNLFHVS